MNNALDVQNLHKTYSDFSLDSVSFSLPAGYIMGFVGQNGAGKTTTSRAFTADGTVSYTANTSKNLNYRLKSG
jgi:ABC-type multidrug transport system ATPase subunit